MYSSIRINGYRGLDSFRMEKLGRVNLLVGTNNSGKTSILECIELLRSAGDPHVLSAIAGRRGEWGHADDPDVRATFGPRRDPLDVSHLFANHELTGEIRIEADRSGDVAAAGWNDRVTIHVEDPSGSEPEEEYDVTGDDDEQLALHVKWMDPQDDFKTLVTDEGLTWGLRRPMRPRNGSNQAVQFVRTSGLTSVDVVRTYSKFVFTKKGEAIKQALRIVEPAVEDIAPVADDRRPYRDSPGGVVLKLRGIEGQVPIGSMGDGMWRMLGLALSVASVGGGVLLVDEIDTGFHYTVMEDMWRMLGKQAAALSVQVFATTHSRDCYESLGAVVESDVGDVTIQRIDRSRGKAISFTNEAVVAAAERNVEIR